MQLGRQQVKETDAALLRSEKIVNDTMAIGIQTAETLQAQTRQLEKVRGHGARHGMQSMACVNERCACKRCSHRISRQHSCIPTLLSFLLTVGGPCPAGD